MDFVLSLCDEDEINPLNCAEVRESIERRLRRTHEFKDRHGKIVPRPKRRTFRSKSGTPKWQFTGHGRRIYDEDWPWPLLHRRKVTARYFDRLMEDDWDYGEVA
jgi:hypothetical protein